MKTAFVIVLCSAAAFAAPRRPRVQMQGQTSKGVSSDPLETLKRARAQFDSLEYETALPLARAVANDPAAPIEARVEALAIEGSTLAITADIAEAEKPFRKLLRLRADFELPPKSPPKILAAFRKVQTEEKQLALELETARRATMVSRMKLLDDPPTTARGGRPLKLSLRLFDPDGAVSSVQVPYRRQGETTWSVLALARSETGAWQAALPPEVTTSEKGFALELYVASVDAKGGNLLTRGTASAPLKVDVTAGAPRTWVPKPVVVTGAALTVAAALTATVLGLLVVRQRGDFDRAMTPSGPESEVDALPVTQTMQRGFALRDATNAMWVATLSSAVITGVLAFFVDWAGEQEN